MSSADWDWTQPVVDHLDLHASDFGRSVRFYETVPAPLGIPKLYERVPLRSISSIRYSSGSRTKQSSEPPSRSR